MSCLPVGRGIIVLLRAPSLPCAKYSYSATSCDTPVPSLAGVGVPAVVAPKPLSSMLKDTTLYLKSEYGGIPHVAGRPVILRP